MAYIKKKNLKALSVKEMRHRVSLPGWEAPERQERLSVLTVSAICATSAVGGDSGQAVFWFSLLSSSANS